MQQDLGESEKGSVWPLSCYNFWPAIARGNVPGLEDLCPEEMRHLQLEAQKTGNMDVCVSVNFSLLSFLYVCQTQCNTNFCFYV